MIKQLCESGQIHEDHNQLEIIKFFEELATNLESSESDWERCFDNIQDPYEMFKKKKQEEQNKFEEEDKKRKQKTLGFFGFFTDSEEDDELEKLRLEKERNMKKMKDELSVDTSAFKDFPDTKGIYLFGNPGSGKTFLMDLFYQNVQIENKTRVHFNEFMLNIHKFNHEHYDQKLLDPLFQTSSKIAKKNRLICLDEFQVADVGDAVIMKRLWEIMWHHEVVLVVKLLKRISENEFEKNSATSNRPPYDLYKNGIQREGFVPFIDELSDDLDTEVDYRMKHLEKDLDSISGLASQIESNTFFNPINSDNKKKLDKIEQFFTHHKSLEKIKVNAAKGRDIEIMGHEKVARINFKEVFDGVYGASDFIAMAKNFEAILVDNVEVVNMKDSNLSRRFILFIDECYNHKVKLYCTSQETVDDLFVMDGNTRGEEMFMIHRCISRLKEMQSKKYMQELHQVNPTTVF